MNASKNTASAIVASVGKGHDFKCGRQFCAWLGLVPGQYSSGGKQRLGRITKAGDAYLRTLLIMGAKAVLAAAKNRTDPVSRPPHHPQRSSEVAAVIEIDLNCFNYSV
jgi:transposase